MTESPEGCLVCNREPIEAYLKIHNVYPHQLEQVSAEDADTMPPCPKCGAIFEVKKVKHFIDEEWTWLVRDKSDGIKEIYGVRYPNGDCRLAVSMPAQQWKAYLRKGKLEVDRSTGNLTVLKPD